jgi:serine/threonine protein kinase
MTLPSIGDVVDDKFRIERKLGEGGTSTIYEVRHAITDKKFAIKWLAPELAQNDLAVQLFVHEARVCGRFSHPNAVQIYDICRTPESYYLLMEFLDGESLEARLQRVERFSTREACDIVLPCTEALSAAHRVGIIHRDLKPSNIILCRVEGRDDEVPKIVDFGISKLSHNGRDVSPIKTTTQTLTGTPLYMAPEQIQGRPAEPRFDVYALGALLYELVAGRPPFDSDNLDDLVQRILESQPARLDEIADVEPGFADVVERAMARNADERFATMAEFAHALRPFGTPVPVTPSAPPPEPRRSEVPSGASRRSWTTTSPGFLMLKRSGSTPPPPAAEPANEPEIDVEEQAVEPSLESLVAEQGSGELEHAQPSLTPTAAFAPRGDESSVELATLDELGATVDSSAAGVPEIDIQADPSGTFEVPIEEAQAQLAAAAVAASAPPAALRAASLGPLAAPIAAPPSALAPRSAADDSLEYATSFGDVTPWVAVDGPRPRLRRKGSMGVLAVVGGALALTLYALTREPNVPPTASTAAVGHSIATETDTSAMRRAPELVPAAPSLPSASRPAASPSAVAAPQPSGAAQRVERPEPANIFDQSSIAKSDPERRASRRAKAAASKRHSSAKERDGDRERDRERDTASRESIAKRGPIVEVSARTAPAEARSASIPGANISRQDF